MADKVVEICSLFDKVHDYCRAYETEAPADFTVTVTPEDIAFEKQKTESEYAYEGLSLPHFSDELLEETAVYRKIAEKMPDYDTFVFHGSAIAVDGAAYLFTAKSGTGKSTHARLWRELLGEKAVMVNDDKPLISVRECGIIVYGTPWNGKHRLGQNISAPLKAIVYLTRSKENKIEPFAKADIFPVIFKQAYYSKNPERLMKILKMENEIMRLVECYKLGCNMNPDAAVTAWKGMKGTSKNSPHEY